MTPSNSPGPAIQPLRLAGIRPTSRQGVTDERIRRVAGLIRVRWGDPLGYVAHRQDHVIEIHLPRSLGAPTESPPTVRASPRPDRPCPREMHNQPERRAVRSDKMALETNDAHDGLLRVRSKH